MPTLPNDQPVSSWQAMVNNVKVLNRSELDNLSEFDPAKTTNVAPMNTDG